MDSAISFAAAMALGAASTTPVATAAPSPSPTPHVVVRHTCYSPSCPVARAERERGGSIRNSNLKTWQREPRCYSASCRLVHRMSYWQHPKLNKLMMRSKISCALRMKPSSSRLATISRRVSGLRAR